MGSLSLLQAVYSVALHSRTNLMPTIGNACHSQNLGHLSVLDCGRIFQLRSKGALRGELESLNLDLGRSGACPYESASKYW